MTIETLPLSAITRISPLNPNQDMESDVSSLAATIRAVGMEYPLKVRPRPDIAGEYEVLDGGRRWRALNFLCASGQGYDDERNPRVEIFNGSEADAQELALILSVTPRPKHPVDEFLRFQALVELGKLVEDIARDFGETVRHVNQRLALAALSPRVRDLWRAGAISAEAAQAYTIGTVEAQEAFLDKYDGSQHIIGAPLTIRRELRGDVMPENEPVSRFILSDAARVQAYVDAGGRVAGDLFTAGALRDAPIAEKVADELLRAEAERLAREEGWGQGLIEKEYDWAVMEDEPEFNEEEEARLDEIEQALAADPQPDEADALLTEQERITRNAILRGYPVEERATLGVVAALSYDGTIYFSRGVTLPDAPAETARAEAAPADQEPGDGDSLPPSPGESGEHTHDDHEEAPPPRDPLADPGKALRAVIDETATKALAETLCRRPDIALVFAVAALGCCYGEAGVRLSRFPLAGRTTDANELIRTISGERFEQALATCAAAPTGDLTVAFARLVALAIDTQTASLDTLAAMIAAAAARGADMKGGLFDALDRRAYFEAIGKTRTLDAIAAMIGEGEAKTHCNKPKDKAAEAAAHIARDRQFLPAPFANWAAVAAYNQAEADAIHADDNRPIDATPLAQAMAEAIGKDEARPKRSRVKTRRTKEGATA